MNSTNHNQSKLFAETTSQKITLAHGLTYLQNFLSKKAADQLLDKLNKEIDWSQPSIKIAGKVIPIPRLQSWQGEQGPDRLPIAYTYSQKAFVSAPFHPWIRRLKERIESQLGVEFNSALCNLYRSGQDSVSWHADDEPELGIHPIIASFSLGAERVFQIKKPSVRGSTINIPLEHNSLLVMPPGFQSEFQHQIPKTKREIGTRINITFRKVIPK